MIIKFGKIELNSWQRHKVIFNSVDDEAAAQVLEEIDPVWYRKLIPYEDYDETNIVDVRQNILDPSQYCYANFYSQLRFLHEYFPPVIEGDLEFAKNYVDNFLVRMSKLLVFL